MVHHSSPRNPPNFLNYSPGKFNSAPVNPPWQWLQDFSSNTNLGPGDTTYGAPPGTYTIGGPIVTYRYNTLSPLGYIPPAPGVTSSYYSSTPVGGSYGSGINSKYGGMYNNNNSDFVATSLPYLGPFTEQCSMYIMPTGQYSWAPPTSPTYSCFEMTINADTQDYSLEDVIVCGVPINGTVNFYYSPNGDIQGTGSGSPWGLNAMVKYASITQNGWYLFSHSYFKAGNGTTDPAISILHIYNAAGILVGSYVVAQSNVFNGTYLTIPNGQQPGSELHQVNCCGPSAYWQPGFANNTQLIGNFGWYLGFPNQTLRPNISNAYNSPGATHLVPYSYNITASNSPTVYGAQFQQGIDALSCNTSTGVITGTPTTAGTYYFLIWATNAYGTDAAWVRLVVS